VRSPSPVIKEQQFDCLSLVVFVVVVRKEKRHYIIDADAVKMNKNTCR